MVSVIQVILGSVVSLFNNVILPSVDAKKYPSEQPSIWTALIRFQVQFLAACACLLRDTQL